MIIVFEDEPQLIFLFIKFVYRLEDEFNSQDLDKLPGIAKLFK